MYDIEEMKKIYEKLANNIDLFDFDIELLQELFKVNPRKFSDEDYLLKFAPALEQIVRYSWIYNQFDYNELLKTTSLPSPERFKKAFDISEVCSSFIASLTLADCTHPMISEWNDMLNAGDYYDAIIGNVCKLASELEKDDKADNNVLLLDGFLRNATKDIADYTDESLFGLFEVMPALNDKEFITAFAAPAYSITRRESLLVGDDGKSRIQPVSIINNKKMDLIYTYKGDKSLALSQLVAILKNIADIRGYDELSDINEDEDLKLKYYDKDGNLLTEEEAFERFSDTPFGSVEAFEEFFREEMEKEKENEPKTIGEFVTGIEEHITYFKAFQCKSILSLYRKEKVLQMCKGK